MCEQNAKCRPVASRGGLGALAKLLTLFQIVGRLCPPQYYKPSPLPPPQIFRPCDRPAEMHVTALCFLFFSSVTVVKNTVRLIGNIEYNTQETKSLSMLVTETCH
jgi:hypothetical protein